MSDDQDTTAPGRVALMYPLGCEKSVLWARPEHYSSVHPSMRQWAPCIARCIWDAALEEMRTRHAMVRAMQVPFCLHCGGLLARPVGCETPGCRPGMAQTAICNSCRGPVPHGLYPCPACQYAPWVGVDIVRVGPRIDEDNE